VKILFLNPGAYMGGAERVLLDLMTGIMAARPGWQLHLITGESGPLVSAAQACGIRADVLAFSDALAEVGDAGAGGPAGGQFGWLVMGTKIGSAAWSAGFYVRRLRRAIADAAPTIVHSNGLKMHLLAARAAPRQLPLVWHLHDYVTMRPMMSRLLRPHARRCAAVIANSSSTARDAHRAFRRVPVDTVRNAIDLARFRPSGPRLDLDALAAMAPPAEGVVRIGLPAVTARWKGHEVFLHALASLPAALNLRGYIIGGPLYRTAGSQYQLDELRAIARRLGLERRIGLTGFVDDMPAAMRSLDVVVHASTQPEPFGLVIAEAMACGGALITSANGGAAEFVRHEVNALVHPAGDASTLAAQIAALAANPALRSRLGAAALRTAVEHFGRERMTEEMIALYTHLAGTGESLSVLGTYERDGEALGSAKRDARPARP
jgi:glycosyltransferase involved in cell wall biosynthesis